MCLSEGFRQLCRLKRRAVEHGARNFGDGDFEHHLILAADLKRVDDGSAAGAMLVTIPAAPEAATWEAKPFAMSTARCASRGMTQIPSG